MASNQRLQMKFNPSLKTLFEELLQDVSIDYTNPEIQDIESSVEELTQRYVNRFNENSSSFHIECIQPCGSMVEKTSLWKSCSVFEGPRKHEINYIEFDYLAVLQKPRDCVLKKGCSSCLTVIGKTDASMESGANHHGRDDPFSIFNLDERFHSEVHSTISSLCGCYNIKKGTQNNLALRRKTYQYLEKSGGTRTCRRCTVYRQTGCLHIATTIEAGYLSKDPNDCSFLLVWKSTANSLIASHSKTLRRSEPVQLLHIFVDFLPAFDLRGNKMNLNANFAIPKGCQLCDRYMTWRASNCISEVGAVRSQLSENHKKCYKVLKCIFAQVKSARELYSFYPKGYHVKCAVLNHGKRCSGDTEDFSKCVLKVVQDLKCAFLGNFLKSFIGDSNLIEGHRPESLMDADTTLTGIWKALNQLNTELREWKNGRSCPYSPEKVVRRIIQTVEEEVKNEPPFEH